MKSKRRPQASKTERFKASQDPTSVLTQRVAVGRCEATGLVSFSMHSVAQARAARNHTGVQECLVCDGYHVEGVFS